MHGGNWVAEVLAAQGVRFIFTLSGGHISPILVGCKQRGIRVVDVRHEANAVFAADATSRLTGVPGVAVVTAGPGVTNTLTAVKNAQLAQSAIVVLGGAAATALQGRGALQDIDQLALFPSAVKWSKAVKRLKDLVPALEQAFYVAQSGVPGPVFLEIPLDLLYGEKLVRDFYGLEASGRSLAGKVRQKYLQHHVNRLFAGAGQLEVGPRVTPDVRAPGQADIRRVAERMRAAQRPLLLIGSQAVLDVAGVGRIAAAVEALGIPVYLSGMARGLLGPDHPLQLRHKRRDALKAADFALLAGVPLDFRLNYGRHLQRECTFVSVNRNPGALKQNRRPDVAVLGDPGLFLQGLAEVNPGNEEWVAWHQQLRSRDAERVEEIRRQARQPVSTINPVHLCLALGDVLGPQTILVADGGDFVATAAYTLTPPGPLTWLDPGPFGTLGVGAGFALGAKLARPDAEVWIIYGDGSAGYSLVEFDTFVRHGLPIIAVVGNDAGWTQIARGQLELLGDDVGTVLAHTDYDRVAAAFGASGFRLDDPELIDETVRAAQQTAASGRPALINAIIGKSDFRKGAISV